MHISGLYSLLTQQKSSSCSLSFNCPALGFQQPPLCPGVPLQSVCSERAESSQSDAVLKIRQVNEPRVMLGTNPREFNTFLLNFRNWLETKNCPWEIFTPKLQQLRSHPKGRAAHCLGTGHTSVSVSARFPSQSGHFDGLGFFFFAFSHHVKKIGYFSKNGGIVA